MNDEFWKSLLAVVIPGQNPVFVTTSSALSGEMSTLHHLYY